MHARMVDSLPNYCVSMHYLSCVRGKELSVRRFLDSYHLMQRSKENHLKSRYMWVAMRENTIFSQRTQLSGSKIPANTNALNRFHLVRSRMIYLTDVGLSLDICKNGMVISFHSS